MDTIIKMSILLPTVWILVQSLLLMYGGILILRSWGLIKAPLAGMEYSQALLSGIMLASLIGIGAAAVGAYYNTAQAYASQPGSWLMPCLLKYCQYFLMILLAVLLLLGFVWLAMRVFLGRNLKGENGVDGGNLPLAVIVAGIAIGLTLSFAKLIAVVIEDMTPHFVMFN